MDPIPRTFAPPKLVCTYVHTKKVLGGYPIFFIHFHYSHGTAIVTNTYSYSMPIVTSNPWYTAPGGNN